MQEKENEIAIGNIETGHTKGNYKVFILLPRIPWIPRASLITLRDFMWSGGVSGSSQGFYRWQQDGKTTEYWRPCLQNAQSVVQKCGCDA